LPGKVAIQRAAAAGLRNGSDSDLLQITDPLADAAFGQLGSHLDRRPGARPRSPRAIEATDRIGHH
jgi:hypothetical protein